MTNYVNCVSSIIKKVIWLMISFHKTESDIYCRYKTHLFVLYMYNYTLGYYTYCKTQLNCHNTMLLTLLQYNELISVYFCHFHCIPVWFHCKNIVVHFLRVAFIKPRKLIIMYIIPRTPIRIMFHQTLNSLSAISSSTLPPQTVLDMLLLQESNKWI